MTTPSTATTDDLPPKRPPAEYWTLLANLEGEQVVSVHVKRTYRLLQNGMCELAPKQLPLIMRPLVDPDGNEVFFEGDVMPVKSGTDLVVIGTVHGLGERTVTAGIALKNQRFSYQVFGKRLCSYQGPGTLRFSTPEPIDKLPLRYENAYGGFDPTVPEQRPIDNLLDALEHQPGSYPRNPVGKGYAVFENRERLDGLELPNVEHPQMLLRPDNLVLHGPEHWWRAPLPWSCDWFPRAWYPRCTYQGVVPEYFPEDDRAVHEVMAQWVEAGHARRAAAEGAEWDHRAFNAASPALVLPWFRGDEHIELTALSESGRMVVALPHQSPVVRVYFRGSQHELQPSLQRVLISTDEMGVSMLWHAAWRTPFELPEKQAKPGDDLRALVGVEVSVDGRMLDDAL